MATPNRQVLAALDASGRWKKQPCNKSLSQQWQTALLGRSSTCRVGIYWNLDGVTPFPRDSAQASRFRGTFASAPAATSSLLRFRVLQESDFFNLRPGDPHIRRRIWPTPQGSTSLHKRIERG